MNVYLELTRDFNQGRLRAVISSGQAVVLHRLAIMSKDGDWILREDPEALGHVLGVLARRNARYRFGAPLDARWMRGGWSAHLEFRRDALRVRVDFVTRPPRISDDDLARLWREQEGRDPPFVGARDLAEIKKTNREKDYAVIGELARLLPPGEQLLLSRSARDLVELARRHPDLVAEGVRRRPLLGLIEQGIERLEQALDAERRALMRANEERLRRYAAASEAWSKMWPRVAKELEGRSLPEAHALVARRAEGVLPFRPEDGP